ncbi:MAG: hypothetical protein CM1200mP24_09470 [Gammaproteobacteria bacterium]|nr:MAG: hypothetical protein CM1200mP24_09470 [Gammaproteobacteria bacterium]
MDWTRILQPRQKSASNRKTAKVQNKGQLPKNPRSMSLPGIGRSTAGAVLSLGYGISAPF